VLICVGKNFRQIMAHSAIADYNIHPSNLFLFVYAVMSFQIMRSSRTARTFSRRTKRSTSHQIETFAYHSKDVNQSEVGQSRPSEWSKISRGCSCYFYSPARGQGTLGPVWVRTAHRNQASVAITLFTTVMQMRSCLGHFSMEGHSQ